MPPVRYSGSEGSENCGGEQKWIVTAAGTMEAVCDGTKRGTAGQGGEFTLDDFMEQMQSVRKMGSLSKIMGMLPGMGQFKDQIENIDDKEIDRVQALIESMTPAERANPKIIDGSRRARIARGSGRSVSDVNQLVDRFFEARKMMLAMAKGGGMPGMPGMPGMGGKRTKARQQAPQRRSKRASGNPAKRAAQERAKTAAGKADTPDGAAAFGFKPSAGKDAADLPEGFELPKELRDLL